MSCKYFIFFVNIFILCVCVNILFVFCVFCVFILF
jgi:hypothetical protein